MNPMKKLLATLLLLMTAVTFVMAQQSYVTLNGHVINQETGMPVAGQTMYISVDSMNYPGYYNQVLTNDAGFYTDQVPFIPGTMPGIITVSTADCNGMMASNTAVVIPGMEGVTLDFTICGNPATGCVASFRAVPASNDMLTFSFFDDSYTNAGSTIDNWFWDFGDGSALSEQNPVHTYIESGQYFVCLYISNADSSCYNSYCMPVEVGSTNPPDTCESSFWYQPDSTGTGYLFKGWSFNNQVTSWTWDFGDGTTAEGQSVSHTFADPNQIYNVCLTTSGADPTGGNCTYASCQEVYIYIPSPCESYFWYYPDSTGTGFTFEGWSMNNLVESWAWDFGDGTTASGQFVTHSFADPNQAYTVCLITTGTGPDGVTCSYTSCQEVYIYIPSPCQNYFDATTNDGNTYQFNGYLLNGGDASYFWDFGDGYTANGQQVSHTYPPSWGMIYNVCLTTASTNPADSCISTSCQTIFPGGGGGNCEAVISAIPDSSGYTYYFEDLSQGEHSFTFWDFGDGVQSFEVSPVHTYTEPGIYWACLTIKDTLNYCWDQTCQEIWVDIIQPGCQASFFAFPADSSTSSLSYQFVNTSAPGYTNQQWLFGDGTSSTEVNPVHTYTAPGIYNACLTIWDSAGYCQNTYCMPVYAGDAPANNIIAGLVLAGNAPAEQGIVMLFGASNNYINTAILDSAGTYNFGGVPAGPYYLYAMLTPGAAGSDIYLPTYYANSLTWQGATLVTTGEPNGWYPINLVSSMSWSQGNGSISGAINWSGTFKTGGTPAANVEIVLFNSTGLPIAYTFSNSEGTFEFNSLPYGEYIIHAEMAGKTTQNAVVILSDGSANASVNFIVTETAINTLGNQTIGSPKLQAGDPYPNPVGDVLYLELNSSVSGIVIADIVDLQGRILSSENISLTGGNNRISIDAANLKKGIYLIRISSEGYQPLQRKFIR